MIIFGFFPRTFPEHALLFLAREIGETPSRDEKDPPLAPFLPVTLTPSSKAFYRFFPTWEEVERKPLSFPQPTSLSFTTSPGGDDKVRRSPFFEGFVLKFYRSSEILLSFRRGPRSHLPFSYRGKRNCLLWSMKRNFEPAVSLPLPSTLLGSSVHLKTTMHNKCSSFFFPSPARDYPPLFLLRRTGKGGRCSEKRPPLPPLAGSLLVLRQDNKGETSLTGGR